MQRASTGSSAFEGDLNRSSYDAEAGAQAQVPSSPSQLTSTLTPFYFKYTISNIMSEFLIPEILLACPKVVGRTRSNFWRDSAERDGIAP